MRKEERTEERIITDTRTVFIADDGTEFDGYNAEMKCKEYEKNKEIYKLESEIKKYQIDEYEGLFPFPVYDEWRDCDCLWYNIKNKDEYDLIEKYYDLKDKNDIYFSEPKSYSAIMCAVEYDGYTDGYYLDEIIKEIGKFLKCFHMNIEIKEGE